MFATLVMSIASATLSPLGQTQEGWATFYANRRAGRRTASGERYDPHALVAAHPTLPFGTQVRVTRIQTGANVVVRIIDRGPGKAQQRHGYVIDLSRAAAESLHFVRAGRARVRLDVVADGSAHQGTFRGVDAFGLAHQAPGAHSEGTP